MAHNEAVQTHHTAIVSNFLRLRRGNKDYEATAESVVERAEIVRFDGNGEPVPCERSSPGYQRSITTRSWRRCGRWRN